MATMAHGKVGVTSFEILVDSDAFVAWSLPDDFFHAGVQEIFARLSNKQSRLVSTNLVIAETATVLSNRAGQATARKFLQLIDDLKLPVIHVSEEVEAETIELFKEQDVRGTSMVDCSNAVVMKRFEIPEIFSFDKFYRHVGLKMIKL
jgi:predicted nucleic acid-binding protein